MQDRPHPLPHPAPGAAGGGSGLPAIDVEMHIAPGALGKAAQEQRGGDRPTVPVTDVGEVGGQRAELAAIRTVQRHSPHELARASRRLLDLLDQLLLVTEEGGDLGPEGTQAGTGQCGDVEHRIAAATRWYGDHGLVPIFRLNGLTGPCLRAALDAAGWEAINPSRVLGMALAPVPADPRGEAMSVHDPRFLAAQQQLMGVDDATMDRLRAIFGRFEVPAVGIVLHAADGRAVASAVVAVAEGIAITGNVVTAEGERRKGYAIAMMHTGLAWAYGAGAGYAALNVEADNAAALALYSRLGFEDRYDYNYRVPARK